MSTPAEVRAAWANQVFSSQLVKAFTENIYNYDLATVADLREKEAAKTRFNKEINFIQYKVSKSREFEGTSSQVQYEYPVEIQYYRETDNDGTNYNDIEDLFETITDVVQANLEGDWDGTVAYWLFQAGPAEIREIQLDGKIVWVGTYTFIGFKKTEL